jgi:DNA topoisomerase I
VWRQLREATKFHRLGAFGAVLPAIRRQVDEDLRRRTLSREKVTGIVVALLDDALARVGNLEYARADGGHGLTTLTDEHVDVIGSRIELTFAGKNGKDRRIDVRDGRLARQVLRVLSTPGERLFVYRNDEGSWRDVDAEVVNAYLRDASGTDVSAKSFRTWGGTVAAAQALRDIGPPEDPGEIDANVIAAVDLVAERLGNTRAVARASYIHPWITKAYRMGRLLEQWDDKGGEIDLLDPAERAVRRVLDLNLPPSADPDEILDL